LHVVNEIPATVRSEHELLDTLASSYGLRLAHFQSHYLPDGWHDRLRSVGKFGKLGVFLIEPADIVIGKFFSGRQKDRDDLRLLVGSLDKEMLVDRLIKSGQRLLSEPKLRSQAEMNWWIVFGAHLPA
jgi:hypothetical protein